MAKVTSNAQRLIDGLKKLPSQVDLSRAGVLGERAAGLDLREIIILDTEERYNSELDPSGNPWAENKPSTIARKGGRKVGYGADRKASKNGKRPAHTGGLLRSQQEMFGTVEITKTSVTVIQGATEQGKLEAQWYSNGSDGFPTSQGGGGEKSGAKNQPARPFWGLTENSGHKCDVYVQGWVETMLVRIA